MISLKDPSLFTQQAYVGGEWVDAPDGKTEQVTNPATGEVLGTVPVLGRDAVAHAVNVAEKAQKLWKKRTAKERSAILMKWYDLMMENQDDLGAIMTAEQGKPLAEAKGEIAYASSFLQWFAEEGKRVYGDVIPTFAEGRRVMVLKEPVGVCAAITPWNFPMAMITRKCAPALAAGCTVVIKPAEDTPLTALALVELAKRAGFPDGVINIVTASHGAEIGGELTANPIVRKLSFTGSTQVGKLLMRQCSDTVKKVSLELGGNAPFIVFDDADLDAAVAGAIASKYRNAGQTCVCANRILVQEGVYDPFAAKLAEAVGKLRVGLGTEEGITQGPLINAKAIEKVEALVEDAVSRGAKAVLGGDRAKPDSNFFTPTILTGVTSDMRIFSEEIFGPVAPLFKFSSEEDAIRMANDTPFGLAAYFYARDIGRIWRVGEALEYGIVGINEGIISTEAAPFGGVKESGIGREGSKYGIDDFVEIKYMCLGGLAGNAN